MKPAAVLTALFHPHGLLPPVHFTRASPSLPLLVALNAHAEMRTHTTRTHMAKHTQTNTQTHTCM